MNNLWECRSVLYVPASNERALAKSASLACDVVLVDLEDSVAPTVKPVARACAIETLSGVDFGYRLRALRINAADTQWHKDDLLAAVECAPDVLVLPKTETPEAIAQLSQTMDAYPEFANTRIWAMMESPMAVLNAQAIAAASLPFSRLSAMVIGSNDLALSAGMPAESNRALLTPWLMSMVAAAKAYKLQIIDAVYNDFSDLQGLSLECDEGFSMGMNGKSLIHPSQLPIANASFSPTKAQLQEAKAIVEAFALPENNDKGVIAINGRMTERLHLGLAEQLIERVERLAKRL